MCGQANPLRPLPCGLALPWGRLGKGAFHPIRMILLHDYDVFQNVERYP